MRNSIEAIRKRRKELRGLIRRVHANVHKKFAIARPVLLTKNEITMIAVLGELEKTRQDVATSNSLGADFKKDVSDYLQREMNMLQIDLTHNSHNFLLLSCVVSLTLGAVSIVVSLLS